MYISSPLVAPAAVVAHLVKYRNVCRDVLGMIINRFGNTDIQNTCRKPSA